jgi:hypothetical protein
MGMAVLAKVSHSLGRPEGGMALTTIFAGFGMRCHPSKGFTCFGIERTWVKHRIARNDFSCNQKEHHQCGGNQG